MSREVMDAAELEAKIEWEGGLLQAIDYGIKYEEVPEEVRDMWAEAQRMELVLTALELHIITRLGEVAHASG